MGVDEHECGTAFVLAGHLEKPLPMDLAPKSTPAAVAARPSSINIPRTNEKVGVYIVPAPILTSTTPYARQYVLVAKLNST